MQDELPEICKEYDSLTCEITALTEKINSLDEDIIEKTELIKEYLQILKDGTDVGLNPPSAVHDKISRIPVTSVMGGMRQHPRTCFSTSVNYIMY